MKTAVDANVLVRAVVRAVVGDDPAQAAVAAKVLTPTKLIAVALPCRCKRGSEPAGRKVWLADARRGRGLCRWRHCLRRQLDLVEKPLFPWTRRRWPISQIKGNRRAFCDEDEHQNLDNRQRRSTSTGTVRRAKLRPNQDSENSRTRRHALLHRGCLSQLLLRQDGRKKTPAHCHKPA